MMKPLIILAALAVSACNGDPADSTSMAGGAHHLKLGPDALLCKPGQISACGLPSNVVIDMSKALVKHTDAEW